MEIANKHTASSHLLVTLVRTLPYSIPTRRFYNVDDSIYIADVYFFPLDGRLVKPSLMRAASTTTRLPTGLVTLAVEVWSRGAQATPSLPGKSSVTTLREHRARGALPSNIKTRSSVSVLLAATIWQLTAASSAIGYSAAGPALWGVPIQIVIFNLREIRIRLASQQLGRAEGDKFVSCFFHECQRPGVEACVDHTQDGPELLAA
ncbi:hypothetical protein T12_14780 [Trichinella patagoniensis]|uniref:Uncharacterized protein n=1 Tax=Trichinella patagoniensis TaxID=990121 RepID=A0A0V0ZCM9_9BILA|nr:hypothetical protein T12_14780 [Trichinella patagoniensis]